MNENKRFKNVEEKLDWGTIQYFTYNCEKITDDEIKDLVNQLLEENEQLKQRLFDLQKENYGNIDGVAFYQEENASLCDKISDLECENEVLKKENEELKASKEYWKGECLSNGSLNQILTNELDIAQKQGYEPTDSFKQYIIGLAKEDMLK